MLIAAGILVLVADDDGMAFAIEAAIIG
jgi:hypothetical protein